LDLSFKKYFDFGTVIAAVFPEMTDGSGPIIQNLDFVLGSGLFTLVETTYRNDERSYLDLKNYLSQKGLRTIYLAPFIVYQKKLDPNSPDETERQKAVAVLKEFVDRAYFLRAEKLLICSGPDPGPGEREKAKKQLVKSLNELLDHAEKVQSDYLLELIFEHYDRDLHMKRLLGPTAETVEVLSMVRRNYGNISLIFDQSHIRLLGESQKESLLLAKDCLGHVHLANCLIKDRSHPQWGDAHPVFDLEGSEMGTGDIVDMLTSLFKIGYLRKEPTGKLPTVSLEVKPPLPGGDRQATFEASCNTFLEAWQRFLKTRVPIL